MSLLPIARIFARCRIGAHLLIGILLLTEVFSAAALLHTLANPHDTDGGLFPLLSSGIYAVHLLLWLFGPIARIQGVRSTLPEGVERSVTSW